MKYDKLFVKILFDLGIIKTKCWLDFKEMLDESVPFSSKELWFHKVCFLSDFFGWKLIIHEWNERSNQLKVRKLGRNDVVVWAWLFKHCLWSCKRWLLHLSSQKKRPLADHQMQSFLSITNHGCISDESKLWWTNALVGNIYNQAGFSMMLIAREGFVFVLADVICHKMWSGMAGWYLLEKWRVHFISVYYVKNTSFLLCCLSGNGLMILDCLCVHSSIWENNLLFYENDIWREWSFKKMQDWVLFSHFGFYAKLENLFKCHLRKKSNYFSVNPSWTFVYNSGWYSKCLFKFS